MYRVVFEDDPVKEPSKVSCYLNYVMKYATESYLEMAFDNIRRLFFASTLYAQCRKKQPPFPNVNGLYKKLLIFMDCAAEQNVCFKLNRLLEADIDEYKNGKLYTGRMAEGHGDADTFEAKLFYYDRDTDDHFKEFCDVFLTIVRLAKLQYVMMQKYGKKIKPAKGLFTSLAKLKGDLMNYRITLDFGGVFEDFMMNRTKIYLREQEKKKHKVA